VRKVLQRVFFIVAMIAATIGANVTVVVSGSLLVDAGNIFR
jgi:hypothetical protein